jgi:hypothetical protein
MNALVDRRHQLGLQQQHRLAVVQPPANLLPSKSVGEQMKCRQAVQSTIQAPSRKHTGLTLSSSWIVSVATTSLAAGSLAAFMSGSQRATTPGE